jgi:hypothetical protein
VVWVLLLLLISCSNVRDFQVPKQGAFYKRTLQIKYEGIWHQGVMVARRDSIYDFTFKAPAKTELLRLRTCHREDVFEDIGQYHTYRFVPSPVELAGPCPIEIAAYDTKGQHSWGFIAFQRDESAAVKVNCNGRQDNAFGTSVCQSKEGLVQELIPPYPMKPYEGDGCPKMEKRGDAFEYKIPKGHCIYMFSDEAGNLHRHISLGYDEILLREI